MIARYVYNACVIMRVQHIILIKG